MTLVTYHLERSLRQLWEEWTEGEKWLSKLQWPSLPCQLWGRGKERQVAWSQHLWSTALWAWHQVMLNIESGTKKKGVLVARCVASIRRGSDRVLGRPPSLGLRPQETSSPGVGAVKGTLWDLTSFFQFPNGHVFPFLKCHCQSHYLWHVSVPEIKAWST